MRLRFVFERECVSRSSRVGTKAGVIAASSLSRWGYRARPGKWHRPELSEHVLESVWCYQFGVIINDWKTVKAFVID
jgi:hypothetical protein